MAEVFDFGLQQHKIKMDGNFFENNLFAVAGDTGRRLEVQLLDSNNLVQNTTGISLRLNAVVAGQATYAEATLVDATKGLYKLDLPNGMLIAPGNWQFQWQIIGTSGEKLHSFAFMGSIGSNLAEGATEGVNFYLNLQDLKDMQEDFISGAFDSSLLETKISEKLTDLETDYAPKLTDITAQVAQTKREKIGNGVQATMADMGQDIKTAMTGGSVAVVGTNGVLEENIVNNTITPIKVSFIEENLINLIVLNNTNCTAKNETTNVNLQLTYKNGGFKTLSQSPTDHISVYSRLNTVVGNLYTIKARAHASSSLNIRAFDGNNTTELSRATVDANGFYTVTFTAISTVSSIRAYSTNGIMDVDFIGVYLGDKYSEYELSKDVKVPFNSVKDFIVERENLSQSLKNKIIKVYDAIKRNGIILSSVVTTSFQNVTINNSTSYIHATGGVDGSFFALEPQLFNIGKSYKIYYEFLGTNDYFVNLRLLKNGVFSDTIVSTSNQTGGVKTNGSVVYTPTASGLLGVQLKGVTTNTDLTSHIRVIDITDTPTYIRENIDLTSVGSEDEIIIIADTLKTNQQSGSSNWASKKWVAYGDSITQQNYYPVTVKNALGLILVNQGVGGARVADKFGTDTTSFSRNERVNLIPTDADLITIMGGTNDWGSVESVIGDMSYPFDTSTYKGALAETIRKIQIRCPKALIVICSNIGGRGTVSGENNTLPIANSLGNTPYDYAKASDEVANKMGVPFIDTWSCGINGFNRAEFIEDLVHPNKFGADLIARTMIGGLNRLAPLN